MLRTLQRKFGTWSALPGDVRRQLPLALATLAATRCSLSVCGLKGTRRWLDRMARLRLSRRRDDVGSAGNSIQAVRVAAGVLPVECLCLPKALATRFLLARRGIQAELVLGARKSENGLDAHAWLELDGQPLGETLDPDMQPFQPSRPALAKGT